MFKCPLFCIVLFIPLLYGKSLSTVPSAVNSQSSANVTESPAKDIKLTNLTMITEGGSINPELPLTLPKENHSSLINLDKELGKTKVKSIVPRKGVEYNPKEDNTTNSTKEKLVKILDSKALDTKLPLAEPAPTQPSTKAILPTSSTSTTKIVNTTLAKVETEKKKKPLTLSAEALNETDRRIAMAHAKAGTSMKPDLHDQLPLPKVRYEQMGSHPGMVMPVVITMLVVPMFAVLGYMALRRGQEAWKNRHYKRMDFLLDGMYND